MARNLEMRCFTEGCDQGGPIASMKDWAEFVKHQKGHNPRLVDADSGEVLGSTPNQVKKVLIEEGILEEALKSEDESLPLEDTSGKTEQGKEETQEQPEPGLKGVTATGMIKYTVTLPPEAFSYYNLAMAWDFDGNDGKYKPFDVWLFECITKRFEKDYKMQLVLAPVEEVRNG